MGGNERSEAADVVERLIEEGAGLRPVGGPVAGGAQPSPAAGGPSPAAPAPGAGPGLGIDLPAGFTRRATGEVVPFDTHLSEVPIDGLLRANPAAEKSLSPGEGFLANFFRHMPNGRFLVLLLVLLAGVGGTLIAGGEWNPNPAPGGAAQPSGLVVDSTTGRDAASQGASAGPASVPPSATASPPGGSAAPTTPPSAAGGPQPLVGTIDVAGLASGGAMSAAELEKMVAQNRVTLSLHDAAGAPLAKPVAEISLILQIPGATMWAIHAGIGSSIGVSPPPMPAAWNDCVSTTTLTGTLSGTRTGFSSIRIAGSGTLRSAPTISGCEDTGANLKAADPAVFPGVTWTASGDETTIHGSLSFRAKGATKATKLAFSVRAP